MLNQPQYDMEQIKETVRSELSGIKDQVKEAVKRELIKIEDQLPKNNYNNTFAKAFLISAYLHFGLSLLAAYSVRGFEFHYPQFRPVKIELLRVEFRSKTIDYFIKEIQGNKDD